MRFDFLWVAKLIHMLHSFYNTYLLYLCSDTWRLSYEKIQQRGDNIYCNHDIKLDNKPKQLRDELIEFQQTRPCRANKDAFA